MNKQCASGVFTSVLVACLLFVNTVYSVYSVFFVHIVVFKSLFVRSCLVWFSVLLWFCWAVFTALQISSSTVSSHQALTDRFVFHSGWKLKKKIILYKNMIILLFYSLFLSLILLCFLFVCLYFVCRLKSPAHSGRTGRNPLPTNTRALNTHPHTHERSVQLKPHFWRKTTTEGFSLTLKTITVRWYIVLTLYFGFFVYTKIEELINIQKIVTFHSVCPQFTIFFRQFQKVCWMIRIKNIFIHWEQWKF